MRPLLLAAALAAAAVPAPPVAADTVIAARTIRAKSLLGPSDVSAVPGDVPGGLADPEQAIGLEARVTLYAGRPIRAGDIGPPAVVERNQLVSLIFGSDTLSITADGRALDRAGIGDRIRVMNLASRATVIGTVDETGAIIVSGGLQ